MLLIVLMFLSTNAPLLPIFFGTNWKPKWYQYSLLPKLTDTKPTGTNFPWYKCSLVPCYWHQSNRCQSYLFASYLRQIYFDPADTINKKHYIFLDLILLIYSNLIILWFFCHLYGAVSPWNIWENYFFTWLMRRIIATCYQYS